MLLLASIALGFLLWLFTAPEHALGAWLAWAWLAGHVVLALARAASYRRYAAQLPWRLLLSFVLAVAVGCWWNDAGLLIFATVVSYYAFALGLMTWTAVGLVGGAVGRAIGKGLASNEYNDRAEDDGRRKHSDHARAGRAQGGDFDPEASPWLH